MIPTLVCAAYLVEEARLAFTHIRVGCTFPCVGRLGRRGCWRRSRTGGNSSGLGRRGRSDSGGRWWGWGSVLGWGRGGINVWVGVGRIRSSLRFSRSHGWGRGRAGRGRGWGRSGSRRLGRFSLGDKSLCDGWGRASPSRVSLGLLLGVFSANRWVRSDWLGSGSIVVVVGIERSVLPWILGGDRGDDGSRDLLVILDLVLSGNVVLPVFGRLVEGLRGVSVCA